MKLHVVPKCSLHKAHAEKTAGFLLNLCSYESRLSSFTVELIKSLLLLGANIQKKTSLPFKKGKKKLHRKIEYILN